jgi:hypothetical protein
VGATAGGHLILASSKIMGGATRSTPMEPGPVAEQPVPAHGTPPLMLATELGSATGGLPISAAVAVAIATRAGEERAGVVMVETGGTRSRSPTMLAAASARRLEEEIRHAGLERVAARGRLCWLCLDADAGAIEFLETALAACSARLVVAQVTPAVWIPMLESLGPAMALLRADTRSDRALAALAFTELRERGVRTRIAARPLGRVGGRRAIAGLDPGGAASRRAERLARGLAPALLR